MTSRSTPDPRSPSAARLQLWIDGCGGYLLLAGNRWSVGGVSGRDPVDVAVGADLPRHAGEIRRTEADYFWHGADQPARWIPPAGAVPLSGSARLVLERPSHLSRSAVLRLVSPHRFSDHVDQIVLLADVVLIGPSSGCHIRCRQLSRRWMLTLDQNGVRVRDSGGETSAELRLGTHGELEGVGVSLDVF